MGTRLAGKIAVVTGAGRGIGEEVARAFCQEGARVVLTARTAQQVQQTASALSAHGFSALAVPGDVGEDADVGFLFAKAREVFGPVEILVNNAGANLCKPFSELEIEEWDRLLRTNLRGPFLCSREALKDMVPKGEGVILNISSRLGERALPQFTAYCASKFGLEGFTRSLAMEVESKGIRVNTLHPGGVTNTAIGAATAPPDLPRERWLPADIVCEPAIYLASEAGRDVTGQCINASEWLKARKPERRTGKEGPG